MVSLIFLYKGTFQLDVKSCIVGEGTSPVPTPPLPRPPGAKKAKESIPVGGDRNRQTSVKFAEAGERGRRKAEELKPPLAASSSHQLPTQPSLSPYRTFHSHLPLSSSLVSPIVIETPPPSTKTSHTSNSSPFPRPHPPESRVLEVDTDSNDRSRTVSFVSQPPLLRNCRVLERFNGPHIILNVQ